MATIYYLTEEQLKNGNRPKSPRQRNKRWKRVCLVLSALVIIEHAVLLYMWMK